MKIACVIGQPVSHSRSPLIHRYWLNKHGVDGDYQRREIAPDDLPQFLRSLGHSDLIGCNVTLPHKEAAVRYVDHIDDKVSRTGSLNTIYVRDGETWATTTDGLGFTENVLWRQPGFAFVGATIAIIGAGGSSRAIIDEMLVRDAGKIIVANRTVEKAQALHQHFGPRLVPCALSQIARYLPQTDLLINTTSIGVAGSGELTLPMDKLKPSAVVADINYVPLITPFLQAAAKAGHATVPGLGMLLHQAVPGFELWFGQRPIVDDTLYDLVAADIIAGQKT
jgi:shikimate dehydrogenase